MNKKECILDKEWKKLKWEIFFDCFLFEIALGVSGLLIALLALFRILF